MSKVRSQFEMDLLIDQLGPHFEPEEPLSLNDGHRCEVCKKVISFPICNMFRYGDRGTLYGFCSLKHQNEFIKDFMENKE